MELELNKNRYVRRAKISEYKFRKMLKYFAEDMSATQIALKTAINRNTVNRYLNEIRERIVEFCEEHAPFKDDSNQKELTKIIGSASEPKADGFVKKVSTNLDFLKRRGKVYAEIITSCTASKIRNLLPGKAANTNLMIHSVDVKEDFGLVAVGYDNDQSFSGKPSYVDNLDRFWSFVKERTLKFQGVAKHKFYVHLKESEFRFNFRNDDLYRVILKLINAKPIK